MRFDLLTDTVEMRDRAEHPAGSDAPGRPPRGRRHRRAARRQLQLPHDPRPLPHRADPHLRAVLGRRRRRRAASPRSARGRSPASVRPTSCSATSSCSSRRCPAPSARATAPPAAARHPTVAASGSPPAGATCTGGSGPASTSSSTASPTGSTSSDRPSTRATSSSSPSDADNTAYALARITGESIELVERGQGTDPWDPSKVVFCGAGPATPRRLRPEDHHDVARARRPPPRQRPSPSRPHRRCCPPIRRIGGAAPAPTAATLPATGPTDGHLPLVGLALLVAALLLLVLGRDLPCRCTQLATQNAEADGLRSAGLDGELLLDGGDEPSSSGATIGREAGDDLAVGREHELLEVPAHVAVVALGVGDRVSCS